MPSGTSPAIRGVWTATRKGPAGAFGPPQRLGDASHPRARLAVDARGDAIVVWVGAGGGLDIVQRPAGGAGASVVQRRLQLFSDELFPALDPRGDAAVAGWSSGSD